VPFFVTNFRIMCRSPLDGRSCHVGGGFHPHLKCLKRLTTLLPDGAARIANDECRSGVNALMKIGA
jgi:hypothetical protein